MDKQTPFDAALKAARNFSNPSARSLVLAELAKAQFASGMCDAALTTAAEIPNRAEKKGVLLHLALECVQKNDTQKIMSLLPELVRRIVETDANSASVAGRLALSLLELETPDIAAALSLLETVQNPFGTDRERYMFFEKLLEKPVTPVGVDRLDAARKLATTFTDENYRDWAVLGLATFSAKISDWPEAERLADQFSQPRRRSWAFFELARWAEKNGEAEKCGKLLSRSADLLEAVVPDPESASSEDAEAVATQLRIIGKFALSRGESELGERLLERCESTVSAIAPPMSRFRARYFLARVMWKLGLVGDVTEYIDSKAVWSEQLSGVQPGLQRSRVLQWLAEAKHLKNAESDWTVSIREAARAGEIPGNDFPQAERIVEIVRRYEVERRGSGKSAVPQGDPVLDAVNLSSEEFEEYYFSPFAIDDCGC